MKDEMSMNQPGRHGPELRANGVWIIGAPIAILLLYFVLVRLVGRTLPVQALLYAAAAVPIACTLAARSTPLKQYSPLVRNGIVIAIAVACYVFYLGAAALSVRI